MPFKLKCNKDLSAKMTAAGAALQPRAELGTPKLE